MAQQTEPHTLPESPLEAIETSASLAKPADNSASTTDSATAYNALPLTHSKSTRVLKILPSISDQTDTIHVELQTISLDDDPPPEFCALSYVWGNPSETRHIMVNNEPFPIRGIIYYSKSELLLFVELTYKTMRQPERTIESKHRFASEFATMLSIKSKFFLELRRKIAAKAELDEESGRQRWNEKIAEELAQLALAVESSRTESKSQQVIQTLPRAEPDWRSI
ncbi:hypothetical protein E8E13_008367 [Curvularia kusanoi]|uniref:Heterokaryon incompatibility domain-containing protein n=1 Tax=Curvularia kusanoi TaxID=90978 RepID=A0A9P4TD47_CURKU|nr:hypothetical protein E8E13_008367 [Curvularia kusanoi]